MNCCSRLYKDRSNGKFLGVCAGIADRFDFDVTAVRVVTVIATVFSGFSPVGLLYIILGVMLKDKAELLFEDEYGPDWQAAPNRSRRSRRRSKGRAAWRNGDHAYDGSPENNGTKANGAKANGAKAKRSTPAATKEALKRKFRELESRLQNAEARITSPDYTLKKEIDGL